MVSKRDRNNGRAPATAASGDAIDGPLSPPQRDTWNGWVEIESEPAFFNVMLTEMGIRGVRVQEVYGVDDAMLGILPQPVHALIFLFRYCESDWPEFNSAECPKHVWFANQTPEFACATFALLNIVNNIRGLIMGPELCEFQRFTADMDPLSRGDAVDDFAFVKRIHNSFARESELLQADMFIKTKAARLKRRQASAKARETKAAKNMTASSPESKSTVSGSRKSTRSRNTSARAVEASSEDTFDDDYKVHGVQIVAADAPRRSTRTPKPRARSRSYIDDAYDPSNAGFHFVAYMPIDGHVWKLDGLDRAPEDLGPFDQETQDWMSVVQPALLRRMERFEGAEIEFNLMAVVHDTSEDDRAALCQNVKTLQAANARLDLLGTTDSNSGFVIELPLGDAILGGCANLGMSDEDVATTELPEAAREMLDAAVDVHQLLQLREELMASQRPLRAAVRDRREAEQSEHERARHQRHNYGTFVREWLRALADEGLLGDLITA